MVYQYGSLTEKTVLNSVPQQLCGRLLLFPLSSIILYHSEVSISPGWLLGQELPDTVKIIKSLSQKYGRKPTCQEEMDFIQLGNPE